MHWVRWLLGGMQVFHGFCTFVWSFEQGSGGLMLAGIFFIGTGLFLGFAPPVRQKENRSWSEAGIVGVVLLVLLAGLSGGVLGFYRYQQSWREEARGFADRAFADVFLQRDGAFLIPYATARMPMAATAWSDLSATKRCAAARFAICDQRRARCCCVTPSRSTSWRWMR